MTTATSNPAPARLSLPRFITVLLFALFLMPQTGRAQVAFDTESEELVAVQRMINETFPDIEAQLKTGKPLPPQATVIMADDSLGSVDLATPEKLSGTESKVAALKEELSIGALKGTYKAVAIFYDTTVANPETGVMTRAIAIFAEHTNDDFAYLFYYPYRVTAKKTVEFGTSFGDFAPQEMYKP